MCLLIGIDKHETHLPTVDAFTLRDKSSPLEGSTFGFYHNSCGNWTKFSVQNMPIRIHPNGKSRDDALRKANTWRHRPVQNQTLGHKVALNERGLTRN